MLKVVMYLFLIIPYTMLWPQETERKARSHEMVHADL